MPNVSPVDNSTIYTATTSGIKANGRGLYFFSYIAAVAGTASIDLLIDGTYYAMLSVSAASHQKITIPPNTTFRVTITGGTTPKVRLTELDWHTA
ncbi:MAG: hypothetical protein Q8L60_10700 [Gammaproteobacteria bacterium]|nr:hypothetical protein [Gammaproteobacteria bacterium]MDP2346817.1 hypothetical protein [Gammaproteobacteria bacterium]